MEENGCGIEVMQVRLSKRCRAVVEFTGKPPDAEGYDMLVRMLEIQKEAFPTEAELQAREYAADTGQKVARVKRFTEALSTRQESLPHEEGG